DPATQVEEGHARRRLGSPGKCRLAAVGEAHGPLRRARAPGRCEAPPAAGPAADLTFQVQAAAIGAGFSYHARHPLGGRAQRNGAARLSLASNIVLVALKLYAGLLSGSISVLAEAIQSAVDVCASALILWTVRAAAAPPDRSHPYGHGKFENIASLGQMLLIL